MTDVLDKIDASLEEVEEQLLGEFARLRKSESDERFARIDADIKTALGEITDVLFGELQNSGRGGLSLITDRHEVLYSRVAVIRHLLRANIRMAQLIEAHDGVKARRKRLEDQVIAERQEDDPDVSRQSEEKKPGLLDGLKALFENKPTEQEVRRNVINVTTNEEQRLEQTRLYLDNGIFSASRELAMLASLTRGGTLDQPPEETGEDDAPKPAGKAVFEARDLRYHAPPNERVSRPRAEPEPEPDPEPEPEPAPEISKRDIAQTPEEIRRKLEARRDQSAAGKATFEAKDLPSSTYSDPPRPRRQAEPKEEAVEPRTGKAVFASKDINPVVASDPPRRREKKTEEEEKEEDEKSKGPARFEARDLSNSPFPKKD